MREPASDPLVGFSSFVVNLETGELQRNGHRIRLQEKPFLILVTLLEQRGGLVTREELHHRLWPDNTFVDFDHNLNNAVNKLREALNDSAEKPRFIETVPRRGYRFTAEVAHKADDLRRSIWPNPVQGIRHAGEPPNSLDVSESPQSTLSL